MYNKKTERRKLIKTFLKALLGYRIYNALYNAVYLRGVSKKLIKKNKRFKNIHRGERCFIFGNGPSIKNLDFSKFSEEYVFTVNQMSRVEGFEKLKTNYHFWSDDVFFKPKDNDRLVEVMKSVNTGSNKPEVFYNYLAKEMVDNYHLYDTLNINYFKQGTIVYHNMKKSFDFTKVIPINGTVVQCAIVLAYYMGFKEIYLLGCECTGLLKNIERITDTSTGSYYAYKNNEEDKKLYSTDIIKELELHVQLLTDYGIYYDYLKKRDIKLINCTPNSLLANILPYERIDEVLKKEKQNENYNNYTSKI